MAGAASGLIEAIQNALPGTAWDQIPIGGSSWFVYGGGGVGGFATLCGVPNGCSVVANMVGKKGLAQNILGYYAETVWPTSLVPDAYDGSWGGPMPIPDEVVKAHITSGSPLCHVSISKWCDAAGVNLAMSAGEPYTTYKQDRCGKICADMAALTAQLINALNPADIYAYEKPAEVAVCWNCHNAGVDPLVQPAQHGTMECNACHTFDAAIVPPNHPPNKINLYELLD